MTEETVVPASTYVHLPLPPALVAAIDAYSVKLSAKSRLRVSRTAAARALIQIGLERADDQRKR